MRPADQKTISSRWNELYNQIFAAVTISGVIWGIIAFSEQHSIWTWISVMVILFGLALVSPEQESEVEDGNSTATADSSYRESVGSRES